MKYLLRVGPPPRYSDELPQFVVLQEWDGEPTTTRCADGAQVFESRTEALAFARDRQPLGWPPLVAVPLP